MTSRRFELDTRAERATGHLRLVAAVAVSCGVCWIALSRPPALGWALVLVGLLVVMYWVRAFRRSRARARSGRDFYLELADDALVWARGGQPLEIPWEQVEGVEVDEDRVAVLVLRTHDNPLVIEPCYRGVGVYELQKAIRGAQQETRRGRSTAQAGVEGGGAVRPVRPYNEPG